MRFLNKIKSNYIFLFVLVCASALRLYNLFEIQYTFDELSALQRIEFDSFKELIKKGVMPDGHPAFVQVFLYYYTWLFGTTEWVVKLPFILSGIASVYLIYSIGKRWFTETTGVLAASIVACSQYFIFYSVIARPYISGLFFSLLALNYWLEILFNDSAKAKQYVYFALFAALSALNHHFSMLFAALCGVLGLFFLSKQNVKKYLLACVGAALIYSPHFPVLFNQLAIGGIGVGHGGWLSPPRISFISNFSFLIFHYSFLYVFAFIGVIGYFFFKFSKNNSKTHSKIRFVLLALFTFSFLIGFFYSTEINAVIQYSSMIFASPCLLLFMASLAGEAPKKELWIGTLLLIGLGVGTLVFKRKYYDFIFNQSYTLYLKTTNEISKEKGNNKVYSMFKGEIPVLNYYIKKHKPSSKVDIITEEKQNLFYYQSIYDTLQANYLILGDFQPTELLQAAMYFPYVYRKTIGYGYELYVLSKEVQEKKVEEEKKLIVSTNFTSIPDQFNLNRSLILQNNNQYCYRIDSLIEYPLAYQVPSADLACKEGESILMELKYTSGKLVKGRLCISTDAENKNIHWMVADIDAFYKKKETLQKMYLSLYVWDQFNNKENKSTFFIWNNEKESFLITEFSIYKWDTNPYRYGLLYDF